MRRTTRPSGNGLVRLRRAAPADARAIARVHVETWRSTYAGVLPDRFLAGLSVAEHTTRWTRMLRPRGDLVLVAEDDAAGIVGFASGGPARRDQMPPGDWSGEVYTLYLLTDWQGRGIGRALLEGLFDRLRERRLQRIALWVVEANPTRFFYEAMGGRLVARRSEPYAGMMLDELAYGWDFGREEP